MASTTSPTTSSISCWRACPMRRPARAASRCSSCRSSCPTARRNDVRCAGIEHKLGIHASPTCTMIFGDDGGAVGWLIGEENRGLACMFTMMNNARLAVGLQGVGDRRARLPAGARLRQRAPAGPRRRRSGEGMSPIVAHPDVQRMLLTMKALTAAARAICYLTAEAIDRAHLEADPARGRRRNERASLLTPVAKAFSTDIGVEVASLGVQVHGGMGFIEETGAAQHLRDARIAPIYEGTNGIQAIDLVTRKLPLVGRRDGAGADRRHARRPSRGCSRRARPPSAPPRRACATRSRASTGRRAICCRRSPRNAPGRGARRRDALSAPVRAWRRAARRWPRWRSPRSAQIGGRRRRSGPCRPHRALPLLRREHRGRREGPGGDGARRRRLPAGRRLWRWRAER